ncbi:MAG TPA: VOC family protein [Terriglobia bacterium]|nr:VOC family protein [Terriglobia bacterium]
MSQFISTLALLIPDYDEAIAYYTAVLGFVLLEDTAMGDGKRWVTVSPPGARETRLLLAKAVTPEQASRIGNQTGGRVFLILQTDDFWRDYRTYLARGVRFCEEPRQEAYGSVAVFEDRYGNRWDLLQPAEA